MSSREDQVRMMNAVDAINAKWGSSMVYYAAQGIEQKWRGQKARKSAAFTTQWDEILSIKI